MERPGIPKNIEKLLSQYGFDQETFTKLQMQLKQGMSQSDFNKISGNILTLSENEIARFPQPGTKAHKQLEETGLEAIKNQQVASVILAGGMATRFGGVVKANVEAIDGRTFLEIKIKDIQAVAKKIGAPLPCWLMASFSTHEELLNQAKRLSSELCPIYVFPQTISLRLNENGEIFKDKSESPSPYAPGHGDLPNALQKSGLLASFVENGGKVIMMSNVDNLTATFDPSIIGFHLSHKKQITAELVEKEPGDQGGAPAKVDGKNQIVEAFRFPPEFDQATIPYFNTNTFTFDAAILQRIFPLTWFYAQKKVEEKPVIQFERLIGELTAFSPTQYVCVPRHGHHGRFHPIKTPEHLLSQTQEIKEVLESRISKDLFSSTD